MGSPAHRQLHTISEYFAVERMSSVRHEFCDGQVYAMAGGSVRHDWLETRTLQALGARLGSGPCFPMTSNRRIAVDQGFYSYADGSVFCGDVLTGPEQTAINPVVLVEVLSDSTREHDRGEKLARYKRIPSLQHVMLVEQLRVDVELWSRGPEGWSRVVLTDRDAVLGLPAIGVELPLREIYDGMERFPV
jgi:Uma2 family endonuclease